jgi:hypothetical protein
MHGLAHADLCTELRLAGHCDHTRSEVLHINGPWVSFGIQLRRGGRQNHYRRPVDELDQLAAKRDVDCSSMRLQMNYLSVLQTVLLTDEEGQTDEK